jgi:hypothetical protein
MSYLDFPRIHFAGGFTAGPSTINNTPENYDPSVTNPVPGWYPGGDAYFKLHNCTVTSVVVDVSGPQSSPLDGAPVITTDNWGGGGVPAKIVDLDPEQQMVSMLYGIQLKIGSGDDYLIAEMEPMWFQNFQGMYASYQSVLRPTEWGTDLSGVLATLHSECPDLLSIKFVIGPPSFGNNSPMAGNIFGTIGPAEADAPINFVPARLLRPDRSRFNFTPALVAKDAQGEPVRLTLDLGSSAQSTASATLTAWAISPKVGPVQLGTVEYSGARLQQQALVFDLDLSGLASHERNMVATNPLVLTVAVGGSPRPVLSEDDQGLYVNATPYVFRIQADGTADVEFWATRFGEPAELEITVADESMRFLPRGAPPPPAVGRVGPGGTPVGWISPDTGDREDYPATVQTGADGQGKLTIAGGNPANFRQFIDGQVYALQFTANPPATPADSNSILSLLVHDAFDAPPTWDNIAPIMAQYAKLYPIMAALGVQLDNPDSLRAHKPALLRVLNYPIEDPRYMPVVRDLSDDKRKAILAWLEAQPDPT